ncbi:hypothetical protein SO802_006117 [Lithocarpus litseifolius]|uniref:Uncharacterized protein n=1 Tax=Lithocarpus litseifolius TaxID=425828 RepID=A0AAW2DLH6_9ROSI
MRLVDILHKLVVHNKDLTEGNSQNQAKEFCVLSSFVPFTSIGDEWEDEYSQFEPKSSEVHPTNSQSMSLPMIGFEYVNEEQNDSLKKIGGRLSKLEESKFKKPIHVEIHDEDEGEDWDERDKAKYERNKQFEKLIADTMAMKEKMDKMQLAFRKARGMGDCLYNMGGVGFKTPIALPPKFKISDVEKFNGIRDPK